MFEEQYTRIKEDFCPDCIHKKRSSKPCSEFSFGNGICLNFSYKSPEAERAYQNKVLHNQAVTIWIDKGKDINEIFNMSEQEILSVLTDKHYKAFNRTKEQAQQVATTPEQPAAPTSTKVHKSVFPKLSQAKDTDKDIEKIHYFYCNKDGKDVVYKRRVNSPSYQSEVKSFRKYLEKTNIKIIKEEVK